MSEQQTFIAVVSGADLRVGDRIPVGFAMYGDPMCPIWHVNPDYSPTLVEVGVKIGEDGPGHYTVVRKDETFTVVR